MCLEIAGGENLFRRLAVAIAGDASGGVEGGELEAGFTIKFLDARGHLIGEHDGSGVFGEPMGEPDLVVPVEASCGILRELDIVGRVGVDEVVVFDWEGFEVTEVKVPLGKEFAKHKEVAAVIDFGVATEGDVEEPGLIEAAEPIEATAIEIVEKLSRL